MTLHFDKSTRTLTVCCTSEHTPFAVCNSFPLSTITHTPDDTADAGVWSFHVNTVYRESAAMMAARVRQACAEATARSAVPAHTLAHIDRLLEDVRYECSMTNYNPGVMQLVQQRLKEMRHNNERS